MRGSLRAAARRRSAAVAGAARGGTGASITRGTWCPGHLVTCPVSTGGRDETCPVSTGGKRGGGGVKAPRLARELRQALLRGVLARAARSLVRHLRREARVECPPPPPPPSRTNRTRRVPHPVLIGHAA